MAAHDDLSLDARGLRAVLNAVDAAITVRAIDGRMVYANAAAVALLRLPPDEPVIGSEPGGVMALFDVYTEAGQPMTVEDLPISRALAGDPSPPAVVVRNVVRATGEERWLINKATTILDENGAVSMVVNLIEDITETKRAEVAARLLAEAARQVAELDDPAGAFQVLADAAVPELADWAGVDVLDESGAIVTAAVAHRDRAKVRLGWRLRHDWPVDSADEAGIPAVIRTGKPELVPEVTEEMLVLGAHDEEHLRVLRAVGLNSIMVAPIRARDTVLGALSFVSSTSRRFDERDLALALNLGQQIGVLIHSARLRAEQARIAHTLQMGLIPQSLPTLDGWSTTFAYRAAGRANEVGGDFYDVVRTPRGWAAVIGAVLGKGAAAASLTALARHTVAAIVESTGDVPRALRVLNRRLRERAGEFRSLCTLAVVEMSDGPTVTVYSAGHPLPVVAGPAGVREIGAPSPILGFIGDLDVVATTAAVEPGETLLLYTDGVLDAVGETGRFGEDGLMDAVARSGAAISAEAIMADLDRFQTGEQNDDIAIVSFTRLAVPAGV